MNVELYKYSGVNERVNKTLTQIMTVNCVLRNSSSIINPTFDITISGDVTNEDLFQCNYIRVPAFNRYYYVTDIVSTIHNVVTYYTHVDVLMSFKDGILNNNALVERNQYEYDNLLDDDLEPKDFNYTINKLKLNGLFNPQINEEYRNDPYSSLLSACLIEINSPWFLNEFKDDLFQTGVNHDWWQICSSDISPVSKSTVTILVLGKSAINIIFSQLSQNSNYAGYVNSVKFLPTCFYVFNNGVISDYPANPIDGKYLRYWTSLSASRDVDLIRFTDNKKITATAGYYNPGHVYIVRPNALFRFIDTTIDMKQFIPSDDHKYLVYSKYSKYELYVPMYGYVEISGDKIFSNILSNTITLNVVVACDGNGSGFVMVSYTNDDGTFIITNDEFNICVDCAVSYDTSDSVKRQRTANTLSMVGGMIGALAGGAGGLLQGINPMSKFSDGKSGDAALLGNQLGLAGAIVGAAGGIVTAGLSYAANEATNISVGGKNGSTNGTVNMFTENNMYLVIYRKNVVLTDEDTYKSLVGKPLRQVRKLSNVYGRTFVSDILLYGIQCLNDERAEIIKFLTSGVILPDRPTE